MSQLAASSDYLATWQLPIMVVLGGVWIFLGGYLLRRNVKDQVGRREAAANRCFLIALLTGLAGAFTGGVMVALAMAVARLLDVRTVLVAMPSALVVFGAASLLTVWASFKLPMGAVVGKWVKSFGPPLAVMVIVMIPSAWIAEINWHNRLARTKSSNCLRQIHESIERSYPAATPPASLNEMVTAGIFPKKYLQAHRHRSREVGYFYQLTKKVAADEETSKLMMCDWVDNLDGNDRTVVYANGKIEVVGDAKFQELLALTENKAFAEALKKAESEL